MRSLAFVVLFVSAVDAGAQTADPSPRLAALRYALANGLAVQRDSVIVAWDRAGEVLAAAELDQAKLEAREMAQLLGLRTRDTSEKSVLQCMRLPGDAGAAFSCATSTRYAVVAVSRPYATRGLASDSTQVMIDVFTPGFRRNERSRQSVAVHLTRSGRGWIGTAFRFAPSNIVPARVPPTVGYPSERSRSVRDMSDGEQREMELAAARHLLANDSARHAFSGFGLDPRLSALAWNKPASRDAVYSSMLAASHNAGHLAALGQVLGTSVVIDDLTSCAVFRPSPCRMGQLAGVVQFTRGLVRENEAQISLFRITRELPGSTTPPDGIVGWRFKFGRSGAQWVVSEMRVHNGG